MTASPSGKPAPQTPRLLMVVIAVCVIGAVVVLFSHRLPLPARLLLAATDLIVAATLVVVLRQKFSGK